MSSDAQGAVEIGLDQLVAPNPEALLAPTGAADLIYSTFLGGNETEVASAVAVDSNGAAYVTGRTSSSDYPTTPGPYSTSEGSFDAFISKLDPTGSALVYSCLIGGLNLDRSYAIDVSGGVAEIAGETLSTDFPTTPNAYDPSCGTDADGTCNAGGQGPNSDAFFVRVNETCTALNYGTYLGGEKEDSVYGLVTENGSTYLTGVTEFGRFSRSGLCAGDGYVCCQV